MTHTRQHIIFALRIEMESNRLRTSRHPQLKAEMLRVATQAEVDEARLCAFAHNTHMWSIVSFLLLPIDRYTNRFCAGLPSGKVPQRFGRPMSGNHFELSGIISFLVLSYCEFRKINIKKN